MRNAIPALVASVIVTPLMASPMVVQAPVITASVGGSSVGLPTDLGDFERNGAGLLELQTPLVYSGILPSTNVVVREMEFDPDPTVLANMLVENTTSSTQTYSITVTVPALLNVAPNQIHGAITTEALDGANNNGATVAAPTGGSIYTAYIDGTPVQTMQADPFTIMADPMKVNSRMQTFGWISNSLPVTSSIAIKLQFTLTAGDQAAILSRFDVVPEPAAFALVAIGGVLLLRRRHWMEA